MPSISNTGSLANLSKEAIAVIRYTNEHNAVMAALVETHNLGKGEDTMVFPKAGQVNVRVLNEGEDMSNEQDLGLTTLIASTNQVGGYIKLSRRLQRRTSRSAGNLVRLVAKQFGEGKARLENIDILGLFSALNGGNDLGVAGAPFSSANAMSIIGIAKTDKFGDNLRFVHHPNAIMRLAKDLSTVGSGQIRPIPAGFSARVLENYWTGIRLGTVPFFETGDITRDTNDDARGSIFDKGALGVLKEAAPRSTTTYLPRSDTDEMVFRWEWLAFEIDDTKGAGVLLDAVDPTVA